jgi:hypothetical protein
MDLATYGEKRKNTKINPKIFASVNGAEDIECNYLLKKELSGSVEFERITTRT